MNTCTKYSKNVAVNSETMLILDNPNISKEWICEVKWGCFVWLSKAREKAWNLKLLSFNVFHLNHHGSIAVILALHADTLKVDLLYTQIP